MKIGIIGLGALGKTLERAFKKIGHKCFGIDIHNIEELNKLILSEVIFICLPTNLKKNKLDINLIEYYLNKLVKFKYKGIIAIKSTLNIGDINFLKKKFKSVKKQIIYVPEFLRERFSFHDFTKNHDLLLIGGNKVLAKKIIKLHGNYPKKIKIVKPIEAEIVKLFSNCYNSNRIVFANSFFEICQKLNLNYNKILNTYLLRNKTTSEYLNCSKNLRGFGGKCLPKDLTTLNTFAKKNTKIKFFDYLLKENNKYKTTIIK